MGLEGASNHVALHVGGEAKNMVKNGKFSAIYDERRVR